MIEVYGIPNCDTVKKARVWLTDNNIEFTFQDFKKITVETATIQNWIDAFGLDVVINKRGTTWRKLSDDEKALCESADTVIPLILSNLSMVKRPILVQDGKAVLIGFKAEDWAKYFQ
ncbi:Spx/MgsR family RNA polymerase-binding regulatory protein [Wohlfahrtiimonas larvae]|uniref:ArsC family reductase n=1 Tax=Wohlfahrtiimonas larvae TaxID=1157986 RepID=A0ABP9MTN6_9GAMM|nr:Spx/MgsR family RNA polymerase-binding regulatory protein [Wohlfahrtiimonas larvae]